MKQALTKILLVSDEPSGIGALRERLDGGYAVETLCDAPSAWRILEAARGSGDGQQAVARYRLTKPLHNGMLPGVLSLAIDGRVRCRSASARADGETRAFAPEYEVAFSFRTLDAARDLATVLADAFPQPGRVAVGLSELFINAIEHGNLGIGYAEKGRLQAQGRWEEEIARRLEDPAHAGKEVSVSYRRAPDCIRVIIRDQGGGFDWRPYLVIDSARTFDHHGRGIALSRMISFDRIDYRGNGNEVEVSVALPGG